MDKEADPTSNPMADDSSNTASSWTSEEVTEQSTSFNLLQRAETPPEYRDETCEDKLTYLEEMISTNVNEGTPQSQSQSDTDVPGDSSNELTDNLLGIQECSRQLSADNIECSPGENEPADSPETSQIPELTDNLLGIQECSQQLIAENIECSPGENESADSPETSQIPELTDSPLPIQECCPQQNVVHDNTSENSEYSPGANESPAYPADSPGPSQIPALDDNHPDIQECSQQQSGIPDDDPTEHCQDSPQKHNEPADNKVDLPPNNELSDNAPDNQECSQRLDELLDNSPVIQECSQRLDELLDNSPVIQECSQRLDELLDNSPDNQECSQRLGELLDNAPIIQECSQRLDELLDNSPVIQECSQRLDELLDNAPIIQECAHQLSVIPDEQADNLQSPPQILESPDNPANVQECKDKLTEESSPHGPFLESMGEPMESQPSDQVMERQSDGEMHQVETETPEHVGRDQFVPDLIDSQTQNGSSGAVQEEDVTSELTNQQTTGLRKHEEVEVINSAVSVQQKQQQIEESLETRIKSTTESLLSQAPPAPPTAIMQDHMTNEEYRCWKDVLEQPEDFDTWVKLLALSEKHENIIVIREIFDRFLKLYPYCYGYWRKFSDLVLRLQGWSTAQQILEIAVYSIPLSIDLWLHYAILSINQGLDYSTITGLYDRSLQIAGYEYRSDLLWEAAIQYQETQNQTAKVFTLLRQLIATPTQHYKRHFSMYETFLSTRSIRELLSEEEFKSIGEHTSLANDTGKSLEEKVRESLLEQGIQVHAATEEEINLRQPFEEKIKRPYFHVQPLEEAQLQTWRSYLDFEISRKYKDRIVFLFERCMIVCALYEEMWIKYGKYLGFEFSQEARAVFQRGTCYIPKGVAIHLEWSYFEENLTQLESARELLQSIDQKVPGLIEIKSHYISFELRHGNKDRVDEQYKQLLQQSQKQLQKSSSQADDRRLLHDIYNYWAAKYAFFLSRHRNEHAVAKKTLADAIEKDKNNSSLYFYLVDLELHQQPPDKDKVMSVLNKAIHAPIPQEVKEIFSLRKFNWARAMGIQLDYRVMNELKILYEKSIKQTTYQHSSHAMRKRPNDYDSDIYAKQPRLDPSVYAGEQAQYHINYAQNQQAYPQYYSGNTNHYQYQSSGQRGEMENAGNQQWGQQYNYQQDWAYQQYQHQ